MIILQIAKCAGNRSRWTKSFRNFYFPFQVYLVDEWAIGYYSNWFSRLARRWWVSIYIFFFFLHFFAFSTRFAKSVSFWIRGQKTLRGTLFKLAAGSRLTHSLNRPYIQYKVVLLSALKKVSFSFYIRRLFLFTRWQMRKWWSAVIVMWARQKRLEPILFWGTKIRPNFMRSWGRKGTFSIIIIP